MGRGRPFLGQLAPTSVVATPQDFTAAWVDLGGEIDTRDMETVVLWPVLDINDTLNARIRVVAKHTLAHADEFVLPIKTVGSSDVSLEDLYYEWEDDTDQNIALSVLLERAVPVVQVQIMAGTVGATAGQIDRCVYTTN